MTPRKLPAHTKAAGRRLWESVTAEFELDDHELPLLEQAVRVADACDDLQAIVDREGLLTEAYGVKRAHPAAVELRQQRILLARLIVALRVPLGESDAEGAKHGPARLQRRGVRGAYAPRLVS